MDKEYLEHLLKEIDEHRGTPFQMANEEIADEMFPYIQTTFPNARMAKLGMAQYIVVTTRAKNILIRQMESRKSTLEKSIIKIEHILFELKESGHTDRRE